MSIVEEQKKIEDLESLVSLLLNIWTVYLKWFTFFYLANLGVLSWMFLNVTPPNAGTGIKIFTASWLVMNLLGLVYAGALILHSRKVSDHADSTLSSLEFLDEKEQRLKFPFVLSTAGALFNSVAYFVNIILWGLMLLR